MLRTSARFSTDAKTEGKKADSDSKTKGETKEQSEPISEEASGGNWFLKIFGFGGNSGEGWGRKFYEGGFADTLDKREAAMILGVRQNAPKEQIMDRYRMLMRVNHPDLNGSPYLASKINDAKELLAARAKSDPRWGERVKRRNDREKRKKLKEEEE